MLNHVRSSKFAALAFLLHFTAAQQCSGNPTPTNSIQTSLAAGYAAQVVATGLTKPRSVEFDTQGNLLVLEQYRGLSSHVLRDNGGVCVTFQSSKDLIVDSNLNHGLALSADGTTLYVSDSEAVYYYGYNATTSTLTSNRTVLVSGMNNSDHTTRTILYPRTVTGQLVVSRGSGGNLDLTAAQESNGISQIKSFDLTAVPAGGYNYARDGVVLGWGLRNDVGVVEHPTTGGIWAVENSFDQIEYDGIDIHENNPGEELNFLGYLNGTTSPNQGTNFGYPYCFTAWDAAVFNSSNITVGTPFAQSSTNNSMCAGTTRPRLTFQAHMAPLDIKFNDSASVAWISFHGSWDRTDPAGYMVGTVAFGPNGEPTAPANSNTSLTPIFANRDNSRCSSNCFRPVGLAFDRQGRMFVASDASGEIYVVQRQASAPATPAVSSGSGSGAAGVTSSSAPSATSRPNGAVSLMGSMGSTVVVGMVCMLVMVVLV